MKDDKNQKRKVNNNNNDNQNNSSKMVIRNRKLKQAHSLTIPSSVSAEPTVPSHPNKMNDKNYISSGDNKNKNPTPRMNPHSDSSLSSEEDEEEEIVESTRPTFYPYKVEGRESIIDEMTAKHVGFLLFVFMFISITFMFISISFFLKEWKYWRNERKK